MCAATVIAVAAAVLLPGAGGRAASSVVRLQVQVAGAAELGLPSGQTVGLAVVPGQRVQQTLQVPLRANVAWVLKLQAAGRPTLPDGTPLAGTVGWSAPAGNGSVTSSTDQTLASGSPTGEAGHTAWVTFDYTASFDDRPGVYALDLTLVLAPQL